MLISISGSQGTGKTTLITTIRELHPHIRVIERKTVRSILADWNTTLEEVYSNVETLKKFQQTLIHRKFEDELEASLSDDIWLTERSFADFYSYTVAYLGKHNPLLQWIQDYEDTCKKYQSIYQHVVYLPGGHFQIADDGVRPCVGAYGRMIDLYMADVVQNMTPSDALTVINTPSIEFRMTAMNALISLME